VQYVAVFFGEFGYELLNWQGALRNLHKTLKKDDQLICCSRKGLYPFYEFADEFIDISHLPRFQKSIACMYWAWSPKKTKKANIKWDKKLRKVVRKFIEKRFRKKAEIKFIFSSSQEVVNGVQLGLELGADSQEMQRISIYQPAVLKYNHYKKILPVLSCREDIEKKVGFSLKQPYLLCQTGNREIIIRSKATIPKDRLIVMFTKKIKVILLNFETGRYLDSSSQFPSIEGCHSYTCSSFEEQSCLIHFAKRNLFFTEGDFRSHNYLPPLLGKDLFAVAPKSVLALPTTSIDFWNQEVFQFGGQILPFVSESIFSDQTSLSVFAERVLGGEDFSQ